MNPNEPKRIYRDMEHKMIAGVCAGIAEYVNVDVTLIRLGMVVFALSGGGILAYLIGIFVIPKKPVGVI